MSKQFAKLCSIVLTLVMLFHMLPHQILADMISTEEMEIPSGGITTETEELDTSSLTVVEEVTDKRTEFSKEFKMSNKENIEVVETVEATEEKKTPAKKAPAKKTAEAPAKAAPARKRFSGAQ